MRARLGLAYADIRCELREVVLKYKPDEVLTLSPKATVPVLHLPDGRVIDESYDIIKWAIQQNDPDDWRLFSDQTDDLVSENDGPFKSALDKYKYASRFPDYSPEAYRSRGEIFLKKLDQKLHSSAYLLGTDQTMADIAIFPFVRQFAHVDKDWFFDQPLPCLQNWLRHYLDSDIFKAVMKKYTRWHKGNNVIYFPDPDQGTDSSLGASSD